MMYRVMNGMMMYRVMVYRTMMNRVMYLVVILGHRKASHSYKYYGRKQKFLHDVVFLC
jgi:hypothetical protein